MKFHNQHHATKGVKGNQPKQREERGGSLIDNFLRRGRSSSKDQGGSRSSSRQGSVEKGKDAESSSSYVSAGSGENFDVSYFPQCTPNIFKQPPNVPWTFQPFWIKF